MIKFKNLLLITLSSTAIANLVYAADNTFDDTLIVNVAVLVPDPKTSNQVEACANFSGANHSCGGAASGQAYVNHSNTQNASTYLPGVNLPTDDDHVRTFDTCASGSFAMTHKSTAGSGTMWEVQNYQNSGDGIPANNDNSTHIFSVNAIFDGTYWNLSGCAWN